jgi:hypothetical protein
MVVRFGILNVRSLYRIDLLTTVVRELGKYKLDLLGVQEVRWETDGTVRAEDYTIFSGQGNADDQLGQVFSYIRESYQLLGEWSLPVIRCI